MSGYLLKDLNLDHSSRPVICVLVRYYLPGYKSGGPVRSVANLIEVLGDEFNFHVICLDRDHTEDAPYEGAAPGSWQRVGKASVFYVDTRTVRCRVLLQLIRTLQPDLVYLNSFFDPVFSAPVLWMRRMGWMRHVPLLLAPRGEFSPGALMLKQAKKRLYLRAMGWAGISGMVRWHASTADERNNIVRAVGISPAAIRVAVDLTNVPALSLVKRETAPHSVPRIVFISRVSPMKNLTFALRVINRLRTPVSFDIWGPHEDRAYWAQCEALMRQAPPHVAITYRGVVEHSRVFDVMAGYDVFFLPTLGENFGHVIMEAMAVGTPVLISDCTPWRGLADLGVGHDLSLGDEDAFIAALESYSGISAAVREAQRSRVAAYAARMAGEGDGVQRNRALFNWAMERADQEIR